MPMDNTEPTDGSRSLPLASPYQGAEVEHVDVFRLLNQLEELPEKAKHLPFNTLVGFNHEQFYYLVLKIRANLPEDMKKAQRVSRDSEKIVGHARDTASQEVEKARADAAAIVEGGRADSDRIVQAARVEADRLVEQSEIHSMATAEAREIVHNAETEADEIRHGADEYARDVLANLEGVLDKALGTVQRGREALDAVRPPQ